MPTLTITFRGLCLFVPAPRKKPKRIHVFLAQPEGMPHVSRRRYQEADGSWTATDITPWSTLTYGAKSKDATMPDPMEMSNFSKIRGSPPMPEDRVEAGDSVPPTFKPHDHRGSHVILRGGALAVKGTIGVWQLVNNPSAGEFFFPYILEWTGEAPAPANFEIWNTIPEEAPTLGRHSVVPPVDPNADPAAMAKHHFKAFFNVLAGDDGPELKLTRTIPPSPPEKEGTVRINSLIVSSCPSGGGDADPP